MTPLLLSILTMLVVSIALFVKIREQAVTAVNNAKATPHLVTTEAASDALEHMKDWAIWLTSIQTGAMAAIGFLNKSDLPSGWREAQIFFGTLALLFLGLSTFQFAWLLGALPSVRLRLAPGTPPFTPSANNDIYTMKMFAVTKVAYFTVEFSAAFCHYFGIVGLACFSFFFMVGVSAPTTQKPDAVAEAIHMAENRIALSLDRLKSLSESTERMEAQMAKTDAILKEFAPTNPPPTPNK